MWEFVVVVGMVLYLLVNLDIVDFIVLIEFMVFVMCEEVIVEKIFGMMMMVRMVMMVRMLIILIKLKLEWECV